MDEQQIADIWSVFKDNIDKKQIEICAERFVEVCACLLYTSPSPRDQRGSRMPSSA